MRDGAKLDPFHRLPWLLVALQNLDSVKASLAESLEKSLFCKRAGDAATPQLRILLQMPRHFFVGDDVGNDCAPPAFQNTKDFR